MGIVEVCGCMPACPGLSLSSGLPRGAQANLSQVRTGRFLLVLRGIKGFTKDRIPKVLALGKLGRNKKTDTEIEVGGAYTAIIQLFEIFEPLARLPRIAANRKRRSAGIDDFPPGELMNPWMEPSRLSYLSRVRERVFCCCVCFFQTLFTALKLQNRVKSGPANNYQAIF